MSPESHAPSALVLVCATGSLLVNVIAWPGLTVIVAGANAKLAMLTFGAAAAAGWPAAGPGWTTILRGALPTGTVAVTLRSARSTTDTSFEVSLVTYAQRLSEVTPIQCGIVPTLIEPVGTYVAGANKCRVPGPRITTSPSWPSGLDTGWWGVALLPTYD